MTLTNAFRMMLGVMLCVLLCAPLSISAASNTGVEDSVRQYFADTPVMISIAKCESEFTMFQGDAALDGGSGGMIGIFQINAAVHADHAADMGMSIYTLKGNLAYARYLYQEEGTQPWMSSYACWGKADVDAATSSPVTDASTIASSISSNLVFGSVNQEVLLLQRMLNGAGYIVAADGPGSRGQETQKFGFATRAAVRKFQCDKQIVCSGDEYSTGYGVVGAKTRSALMAASPRPAPVPTAAADQSVLEAVKSPSVGSASENEEIARLRAIIAALTEQLLALQRSKELASR